MDNSSGISSSDIIITYNIPGIDEPIELPFGILDEFQREQSKNSLVMGVMIGSCSVLLIFLLGILFKKKNNKSSNSEKSYKTLLFYLNCLITLTGIFRAGCFTNYLLSSLNSSSFTFTGLYNNKSYIGSEAANGFRVVLFALIEISMVFQVFIIFKTPKLKIWGYIVTFLSTCLALVVIGFQINSAILSHKRFINTVDQINDTDISSIWLDLPTILFSISVNIMSILLIGKLIFAIKTRRFLGLKQFDGFHILLICSTQTLIIPSMILFIHYFTAFKNSNVLLVNISTLLIVLMLPLSSLWAQTANDTNYINDSPSFSFLSRESSGISTLHSASASNGGGLYSEKITKLNIDATSPITLKNDNHSINYDHSKPIYGFNGNLPPDIQRILNDDGNIDANDNYDYNNNSNIEQDFISTEVTYRKV